MSEQPSVRVGFIGSSWAGRIQIPAFRLGGLTPQAIASGQIENAQRVADEQDIPQVYADWQELIQSDSVDLVSIVTPPGLHRQMAIAALEAGKHVICEKPTALTVAEAEEMLAAAQAHPNQLAVIDHELRFTPQRQKLRQLVREKFVGQAVWVELVWRYPRRLRMEPWNWWSDIGQGGGALGAIGSHLLDLARWTFGRVDSLSAQLKTGHPYRPDPATDSDRRVTADDHAHIDLQFVNGLAGTITASAIAPGPVGMRITLYGTEGALLLDEEDRLWRVEGEAMQQGDWQEIAVEDPVRELEALPDGSPFARGSVYLAQAIGSALASGEQWIVPAASFYDGFKVQQMLEAARQSAAERIWMEL